MRSIAGFKKPQGVGYVAPLHKLFVASADDGMVRVFDGRTFALRGAIQLEPGPIRVAYGSHAELLYVGYGGKDAGKEYGEIAIINAKNDKKVGDIRVARPIPRSFWWLVLSAPCLHLCLWPTQFR